MQTVQTGHALSLSKNTGANRILSTQEQQILNGFVYHQNDHFIKVGPKDYRNFVKCNMCKSITKRTALNYLHRAGFSCRLVSKRSHAVFIDADTLINLYWEWIISCRQNHIFTLNRFPIASIDFTYTSHRAERDFTFVEKGSTQPKIQKKISKFTNCLLTCIWSDGINHTPCVMYTYNQDFCLDAPITEQQRHKQKRLLELLDYYGIAKHRVKLLTDTGKKSAVYVRESSSLVIDFFNHYKVPKFTTILSDERNCYFKEKKSILENIGFQKHISYPSCIHQWISPNDNRVHATSKASWRRIVEDFDDDVNSSLFLMHCIDMDTTTNSKKYWEDNMISPTTEKVQREIKLCKKENQVNRQKCLHEYHTFMKQKLQYENQ